ncbi:TPA: hypothetical protein ACMDNL_002293, partial [Vibrio cholerae]
FRGHHTHMSYSIGAVNGIVDKGTLLVLDEALMDGWMDGWMDGLVYESPLFPMTLANGDNLQ